MRRRVSFHVPGIPIPQPRPRASRRGEHIHIHSDSAKSDSWKGVVQYHARQAMNGSPYLVGPLELRVRFVFPYLKGTAKRVTRLGTLIPKATRPDWDNLGKALCDALVGVVCADDGLYVKVTVSKYLGPEPGAEVEVEEAKR